MPEELRPVIIVDAMSLFVRSYCAYPQMNANGEQMGGCIGFLKTLKNIVREVQPSNVYICWESGGSSRRRKLLPEYKLNRAPGRKNRYYEDDIPDTEENRHKQVVLLISMLKCAPVCQLHVSDCEGDDLIGYLSCGPMQGIDKVIVSSDKDLFQLLNDRTRIFNLHSKNFVMQENVMERFRVRAKHFAIAKALAGDAGDNIPGITGVGFKTVSKLFPMLGLDDDVLLQDVLNYAASHVDESRMYKRILDCQEDVKRNWKLVFLNGNMIPPNQQASIDKHINDFVPRMNKYAFIKLLVHEGIGDFNDDDFFYSFNCISNVQLGGMS